MPDPLSFFEQLEAVPIRNAGARVVSDHTDCITLSVALKYPVLIRPVLALLSARRARTFELRGLGLRIYRRLDGKVAVRDLITDLRNTHKLSFFEARGLVVHSLGVLMQNGLIVIASKS